MSRPRKVNQDQEFRRYFGWLIRKLGRYRFKFEPLLTDRGFSRKSLYINGHLCQISFARCPTTTRFGTRQKYFKVLHTPTKAYDFKVVLCRHKNRKKDLVIPWQVIEKLREAGNGLVCFNIPATRWSNYNKPKDWKPKVDFLEFENRWDNLGAPKASLAKPA